MRNRSSASPRRSSRCRQQRRSEGSGGNFGDIASHIARTGTRISCSRPAVFSEFPDSYWREETRLLLSLGLRYRKAPEGNPAKNTRSALGRFRGKHTAGKQLPGSDCSRAAFQQRLHHRCLAQRGPLMLVAGDKGQRLCLERKPPTHGLAPEFQSCTGEVARGDRTALNRIGTQT